MGFQLRHTGFWTLWAGIVLALGLALPGVAWAAPHRVPGEESLHEQVRVIRSDGEGVLLEIVVPTPQFLPLAEDPGRVRVEMAGYGRLLTSGAPQLPVKGIMVGVLPGAEISVHVLEWSDERLPGSYHVEPAPTLVMDEPTLSQPLGADMALEEADLPIRHWEVVEDPAVYGLDALYPAQPVLLTDVGYLRHQRLARLEVHPLRINPSSGQALLHRRLLVEVRFHFPAGARPQLIDAPMREPEPFERLLAGMVVNYDSARAWRDPTSMSSAAVPMAEGSLDPGYRIAIRDAGLYELSHADLQAAGLPPGVDSQTLQMFHHDEEIAIHVHDPDGTFDDEGDYVLFWGEAVDYPYAKYSSDNVYWLTHGAVDPLRMAEQDGTLNGAAVPSSFVESLHYETNQNYWPNMPGDDDHMERWYWDWKYAPATLSYTPLLTDVRSSAPAVSATLRTLFWGFNDDLTKNPDHHVEVSINDTLIGEFYWNGISGYQADLTFDQALLSTGVNTVTFTLPGDTGASVERDLLDWFDIEYHRLYRADGDRLHYRQAEAGAWEFHIDGFSSSEVETFDVTDPLRVVRVVNTTRELSGTTYLLKFGSTVSGPTEYWSGLPAARLQPLSIEEDTPSDLRSTSNGADYIMIAHGDFLAGTEALADYYKTTESWRVELVDVQDVYDEFGGGVPSPVAIRVFLGYAFTNWTPPAPTYVLLVGDGHFDYLLNYSATDVNQYIPPYVAPVDPYTGETATDNRYACFGGETGPNACWASMFIGRFPVNNATELATMVNRAIAYQQSPAPGDWRLQTTFVADDPDGAGDFRSYSNEIADNYLPDYYTAEKVYFKVAPYDTASKVKDAIVSAINAGRLLVNYIGHAADYWWAEEKLFHRSNIGSLTNSDAWPIMLPMTCKEGRFAWYVSALNGLSESIVRAPDGGAVASWGATGLGVAVGHDYLEKGFFGAVFRDGVRRLGEATYWGKSYLWTQAGGSFRDLVETYVLLGDPALHISVPDSDVQIEKTVEPVGEVGLGDTITYTLSFTNTGPDMAYNVVLSDIIPPQLADPMVIYSSTTVLTQQAGITFSWLISDLPPGAGGRIQVRAIVSPTAGPGLVVNEAYIEAHNDLTSTNNVASTTTGIRLPDLVVGKIGPAQVTYSETITYTITWENQGSLAAPGVRITDVLPAWVEYVSDSSGFVRSEPLSGTLVWEVSPDPVPAGSPGGSFVLTGWVTMDPAMAGPLVNQVFIGSDLVDFDSGNDADEWSTELLRPDLGIAKGGPPLALFDTTITYTIVYSNAGNVPAEGVVITDILPGGVSYVSDDGGLLGLVHEEPTPGTHVWQVGPVTAGGGGGSFHVRAQVGSSLEVSPVVTNTVWIGARSPDSNPANDEDRQVTRVTQVRLYLPLIFRSHYPFR